MWIIEIVVLLLNIQFVFVLFFYLVLRFFEFLYIFLLNLSVKDFIKLLYILILYVGVN